MKRPCWSCEGSGRWETDHGDGACPACLGKGSTSVEGCESGGQDGCECLTCLRAERAAREAREDAISSGSIKPPEIPGRPCANCGEPVRVRTGPGRPPRYCLRPRCRRKSRDAKKADEARGR